MLKNIREQREHSCDDLVLKNNFEPVLYARALLYIGKFQLNREQFSMNAVSEKHQLLKRIQRIIEGNSFQKPEKFSARILAYCIAVFFFFCLFSFMPVQSVKEETTALPSALPAPPATNTASQPVLSSKKTAISRSKKQDNRKKSRSMEKGRQQQPDPIPAIQEDQFVQWISKVPPTSGQIQNLTEFSTDSILLYELSSRLPAEIRKKAIENLHKERIVAIPGNPLNRIDFKKYLQMYEAAGTKYQNLLNALNELRGTKISIDSLMSKSRPGYFNFDYPAFIQIRRNIERKDEREDRANPLLPHAGFHRSLKIANI